MKQNGKLYLCATPIGNLEDITLRVLRTLREVDLIAAEDTRNSIKLLNHFDIKTPMTSYHEYNKIDKGHVLVEKMLSGTNIALITDAGTPGISDPGEEIVKEAIKNNIEIIYSDLFNKDLLDKESLYISKTNYFKYSKEILGSINIARKYVDGIVFLSSFPCSLDAISNELAILKCDLPCINIIIDDINSITGIDSRIESFCDIIERKKVC